MSEATKAAIQGAYVIKIGTTILFTLQQTLNAIAEPKTQTNPTFAFVLAPEPQLDRQKLCNIIQEWDFMK